MSKHHCYCRILLKHISKTKESLDHSYGLLILPYHHERYFNNRSKFMFHYNIQFEKRLPMNHYISSILALQLSLSLTLNLP